MNYWIRFRKDPVSHLDLFFENTHQDWDTLRAYLAFGYEIESVEVDPY